MENTNPIIDADNNLHLSALPEFDIKHVQQLMDEIAKIVRDSRKRMRELAEEFASRCDLKGQNGHTALLNLWHETQDIYLRASSIVGDASELKRTMIAGDRDASSADSECNILYGMYNDLWNRWKDADDASRHALGRED